MKTSSTVFNSKRIIPNLIARLNRLYRGLTFGKKSGIRFNKMTNGPRSLICKLIKKCRLEINLIFVDGIESFLKALFDFPTHTPNGLYKVKKSFYSEFSV